MTLEHGDNIFQFGDRLVNQLFVGSLLFLCGFAINTLPGTTDRKALLVEERSYLSNQHNIQSLIVAAITPSFDRVEAGKFLLPVTQHMGLDRA